MQVPTDHSVREPDAAIGGGADTPQVRTLLLTDLCDSTQLVERLGDAAAAELFREHDRLVLGLQQQWRGRLIDRSDGLLLLFERAIDGLGFALDYARGLRGIGERRKVSRHGLELRARTGLHVGEVLTWRNSDAAVSFGAKPLEVEGLAKPMAGRLMTLARPGQILLSATAEPLAHRAANELGERGGQLLWKDWGRWRFKGVPQAQQVYEVGEPGIAPLRAPQPDRGKAWRDVPLWRRPAALAAELLLVAGLAAGAWFLARPQPAIAFGERDWVVVGDLRNLTGDALLDDSLQQAFRISLEQSRYVNVLSDLKARDTLANMRLPPGTAIDRDVASGIALRDGARAAILPTVAEIGGRLRFSAEVVDPRTQATVYAVSADGSDARAALAAVDKVASGLRGKLGEALAAVQENSVSLPNATTASLDALKAYALGRRYSAAGDLQRSRGFLERALQLDPEFALAAVALGALEAHGYNDFAAASRHFAQAQRLRDRLPPRDALKLDATIARIGSPGPAIEKTEQLLALYPDELDAHLVLAQLLLWSRNDAAGALAEAQAASVRQAERFAIGHYMQGIALLALERPDDALVQFRQSKALGYDGARYSHAYAHAVRRDWAGVARVLQGQRNDRPLDGVDLAEQQAMFALDRGDHDEALAQAARAVAEARDMGPLLVADATIRQLAVEVAIGGDAAALSRRLRAELARVQADAPLLDAQLASYRMHSVLALGALAARLDDAATVRLALAALAGIADARAYPLGEQLRIVLEAELERMDGAPGAATRRLLELAGRDEALAIVHATLMRCELAAGDRAAAAAQARWLAAHRGRAYVERPAEELLSPLSVADSTPDASLSPK